MSQPETSPAPAQQIQTDEQKVSGLQPGHGEVNFDVQSSSSSSLDVALEGGYKFTPNWAAFGDAWSNPFQGTYGGDAGVSYKNLTLFGGGWASTSGETGAQAGVSFSF